MVVGGDQLTKITNKELLLNEFIKLTENADVVVACRVSPKQKAEIVNLVKDRKKN